MNKEEKIFIAAVSGGPDSMAMLDLYKEKVKAVCFVNYHDRDDTYIDQDIVTEYCNKFNLKLHILDVTEEIYQLYPYNNYQDQCRRIRYNFFNETAKIYNLKDVIVAHNYNDFLETAYSQIINNKKNMFLGMKTFSTYKNVRINRPLINYLKVSLRKYCDDNNIKYALDKTNDMDIYQRNINRKLLNSLSKETLKKLINYINHYNFLNEPYEKEIQNMYSEWKAFDFDISLIINKTYFYQYHLIYNFLSNNFVSRISKNKIEQIIQFIMSKNKYSAYRLSSNIFLIKENNKLKLARG